MFPFATGAAAGEFSYDGVFVTAILQTGAGTTAALSSLGVVNTDFALIASLSSAVNPTTPGGAWETMASSGGGFTYWYRQLNSTDVGSGITTSADGLILIWSGGIVSAAERVATSGSANPLTASGFTKAANHVALAAFAYWNGGEPAAPSITAPATWTKRGTLANTTSVAGFDRLSPPEVEYVDGTGFSLSSSASSKGYAVLELLS